MVIAAALDAADLSGLKALLQSADWADGSLRSGDDGYPRLFLQDAIGGFSKVGEWLDEHNKAHAVVMMAVPNNAIGALVDQGKAPFDALNMWLASVEPALAFIRRHRRRISLLLAEPALAEPKRALQLLAKRLQIELSEEQTSAHSRELSSAMSRLLAECAIRQSEEARMLVAEIQATALPVPARAELFSPKLETAFNAWKTAIAGGGLKDEKDRLLAQLQDVQEENELLLLQLHQVQEELEYYYLLSTQPSAQPSHPTEELEAAHEAIRAIYNSYSWKITKPLRWLQYRFSGGRARASDQAPMPESLSAAQETIRALHDSKSWKLTRPLRATLDLLTGRGRKTA